MAKAKLTLEQITPYIPYRVKGFNSIGKIVDFTLADGRYHLDKGFVPILRPLDEISDYFENLYGDLEHQDVTDYFDSDFLNDCLLDIDDLKDVEEEVIPYGTIKVLVKHHFDVFGLIEIGLAKNILELSTEHLKELRQ